MVKGLDLGARVVRAAGREDGYLSVTRYPTPYVAVDTDTVEDGRFERDDVLRVTIDGQTYVMGDGAATYAAETRDDLRTVLDEYEGPGTGVAEPLLRALIETVLGHPGTGNEPVCFTATGRRHDPQDEFDPLEETLGEILSEMGYDPTPLPAGLAVIYAELAEENYTGLGINVGQETTSVCLTYYAIPVLTVTIPRGKHWILDRAAELGEASVDRVVAIRDSTFDLSTSPRDEIESALGSAYEELLFEIVEAVRSEADVRIEEHVPVTVVAAGEAVDVPGAEAFLGFVFEECDLPFPVHETRIAEDPVEAAVEGAVAAAQADIGGEDTVLSWSGAREAPDETVDDGTLTQVERPVQAIHRERGEADGATEEGPGTDDPASGAPDEATAATARSVPRDHAPAELAGTADDPVQQRIASLEGAISRLDQRVSAIEGEPEGGEPADRADLIALRQSVERLDARIDGLEGSVDEAESGTESSGEGSDGPATESEPTGDTPSVTALSATVEDLHEDVRSLEGRDESTYDTLAADVERIDADVASVDDRVATLVEDAEALDRLADDAEELVSLAAAAESLTDLAADAETIRADLDDLAATLDHLEATTAPREDVESVEASVETLRADLDRLDDATADGETVDDIAATVDDLAETVDDLTATLDGRPDRVADETTVADLQATVDRIEADLAETADLAENLVGDLETLANRSATDERVDDLADELERVEERTADAERVDETLTEVERALTTLDGSLRGLRASAVDPERIDAIEARLAEVDGEGVDRRALRKVARHLRTVRREAATEADVEALATTVEGALTDLQSALETLAVEQRSRPADPPSRAEFRALVEEVKRLRDDPDGDQ